MHERFNKKTQSSIILKRIKTMTTNSIKFLIMKKLVKSDEGIFTILFKQRTKIMKYFIYIKTKRTKLWCWPKIYKILIMTLSVMKLLTIWILEKWRLKTTDTEIQFWSWIGETANQGKTANLRQRKTRKRLFLLISSGANM